MTVVIAGGSGFLGTALADRLRRDAVAVHTLTRRPRPGAQGDIAWVPDGTTGSWAASLADADAVVNLAGEGIADRRWTAERKRALKESRILSTRSLVHALAEAPARARRLVNGSAMGIYGARGDEPITEETPPGDDFLAQLCVEWEAETARASSALTSVACVRTGLVLHPQGGALRRMLLPFRLGVGGPLGSGRQYMPWIHRHDWVELVVHLLTTPALAPPYAHQSPGGESSAAAWNATAPNPVTNAEFSRAMGRALHRPAFLPAPAFAIKLLLGELSSVLLTGARVLPAKAQAAGFAFRFPELDSALRDLLA